VVEKIVGSVEGGRNTRSETQWRGNQTRRPLDKSLGEDTVYDDPKGERRLKRGGDLLTGPFKRNTIQKTSREKNGEKQDEGNFHLITKANSGGRIQILRGNGSRTQSNGEKKKSVHQCKKGNSLGQSKRKPQPVKRTPRDRN